VYRIYNSRNYISLSDWVGIHHTRSIYNSRNYISLSDVSESRCIGHDLQ